MCAVLPHAETVLDAAGKRTFGKRFRSKALNSSYSKALLISTILSDRKLNSTTCRRSHRSCLHSAKPHTWPMGKVVPSRPVIHRLLHARH